MNNRLIAVAGFRGSGKDTIGDYLCHNYGYMKDSFASPLKDACAAIFNWDREMLEGSTSEARAAREEIDSWWAERLDKPDWSPRRALQFLGTEVLRENFHDSIWLESFEKRFYGKSNQNIVVTDCRFGNELALIEKLGGTTISILRGTKPEWWNLACIANKDTSLDALNAVKELNKLGIHSSEYSWVGRSFDYEISNNGSFKGLYEVIDSIV